MAHTLGPCRRAKRCANESCSALRMKLISPCRNSITSLWRWLAMALKPIFSNTAAIAIGSGAAYSMNSKPAVPIGLSQGLNFIALSSAQPGHRQRRAVHGAGGVRGEEQDHVGERLRRHPALRV